MLCLFTEIKGASLTHSDFGTLPLLFHPFSGPFEDLPSFPFLFRIDDYFESVTLAYIDNLVWSFHFQVFRLHWISTCGTEHRIHLIIPRESYWEHLKGNCSSVQVYNSHLLTVRNTSMTGNPYGRNSRATWLSWTLIEGCHIENILRGIFFCTIFNDSNTCASQCFSSAQTLKNHLENLNLYFKYEQFSHIQSSLELRNQKHFLYINFKINTI